MNFNNYVDVDRRTLEYIAGNQKNYEKQFFCLENGKILQYYLNDNEEINKKEFAYIHFQQKKPTINFDINEATRNDRIILNSSGFFINNGEVSKQMILGYSEKIKNIENEKKQFKKDSICKFFKKTLKNKVIRVKQEIYKKI